MFRINEVLRLEDNLYRILSLLPAGVVWISLEDESAFPELVHKNELLAAIDDEVLRRVKDPYEELTFMVPGEGTIARIKRDKNYDLIGPLIGESLFYVPKIRSKLIAKIIEEKKTTKQNIYKLVRRYWQRGQTPNALIPDYVNSGGRGKKRYAKDKKLGRPRKFTPGVGAIIDEYVEKLFRRMIERHLFKKEKCSFPAAHRKFKDLYKVYFPDIPEEELPSRAQMLHFYKREYGVVDRIKNRTPRIEYNKDVRPLSSTVNANVLGPGSRYEIDATIADIYLVSNSDRRNIVGRPVVYLVIDVFSRMVAGLYIGFENPSYVTALQALSMAMTSKVEYCKKFNFDISEEDWPVIGLPDAILADRGELLGHQIESLESIFHVRIENTPPYRGDAKGIVERYFKTIQADFKIFAPGVVTETKIKKRGGKDYRLDAKLTVTDFTEIILGSILYHNRFHTMKKYDRDIDMPADLPMIPLAIWNWGVQHRTGRLRVVSEDALKIGLLPRIKGTISSLGVCVFGLYFTSQEIIQLGWLHRTKDVSRPGSLEIAYDPRTADYVYLFPKKNSMKYWVCNLTPRSRQFSGCSFWDVWQVSSMQKKKMAESTVASELHRRKLDSLIEEKIKFAEKNQPRIEDVSNVKRIEKIRPNRKQALDEERQQTTPFRSKQNNNKAAEVIPLVEQDSDYSYPDLIDELFSEDD
ncbi:MAG: DDE-type integrase/transposase/recombinase [Desulfuromonas sp.]|nr:DDE-type integrase/transposase/recombinase [Desulfuromonas sp.]